MGSPDDAHKDSRFVRFIIEYYRKWGYFISKHDWKAIVIVLIISSLFNIKLSSTQQKNDITGNADYDARSLVEYQRYKEFFGTDGWGVASYIFLLAKDNGSMIRDAYLNETIQVLDLVTTNLTIFDKESNRSESFKEFCLSFCNINDNIMDFYNGLKIQTNLSANHENSSSEIDLNYPVSQIFGREVNLMQNFFGVESDPRYKHNYEANGTSVAENGPDPISGIKYAKMIVLQLRAEQKEGWTEDDVRKYEMELVKFLNETYKSDKLKIYVFSKTYIEDEMVRATNASMPYLGLGFLVMCLCSVISVLISATYMGQRNYMKIVLAVLACILPFMSYATAMGILFMSGVRYASILVVVPFLVLAIAVDSSYLLIHEWQHIVQRCRDHPGPKTSDVGYRLAETLAEIGPSILISALTNILADFIGLFTSSEEIMILCAGTLVAMIVAYIYQMTFYIACMSRMGRYELAQELKKSSEVHQNGTYEKDHAKTARLVARAIEGYVKFLSNKVVAITIVIIYVAFIVISAFGITKLNINLTTQKLFALDSPLIELDNLRIEYQVPQYSMATIFVNKPGNLSNSDRLKRLGSLVNELESINGSWGPVGTRFFLREFLNFEYSLQENENDEVTKEDIVHKLGHLYNPDDLLTFLSWPEYTYYRGFLKFKEDTDELEKFFFTTSYHGDNLRSWIERFKMLTQWREVVDKYKADFDVSVFHEDGIFLDLIEYMPINTFQSILGILVCMAGICLVFLKSIFTVTISSLAVLSIFTGLLGSMSYLGMDLDPITMAAMIIALGYSVDIPAHVSFHYHQAAYHETNPSPQQRLVKTLSTVAFPVIQAGISTCICVTSLLFIGLYMSKVFVKSTVLTVSLCIIHGLVILPVLILLSNWIMDRIRGKRHKVQDSNTNVVNLKTFKISAAENGLTQ